MKQTKDRDSILQQRLIPRNCNVESDNTRMFEHNSAHWYTREEPQRQIEIRRIPWIRVGLFDTLSACVKYRSA